ncbi:MAG TPA: oligosaccharide flippase family protein [Acidobacteriota bacterium]|jgi:O-antigen/teichoic acid export membrane protein
MKASRAIFHSIIGRSIAYKFLADSIGRLASFLLIVMIARLMGAGAIGIYAFANGLAAYLSVASDLGMHLFVTREIAASSDAKRLVGSLSLLKVFINGTLGALMSGLTLYFFPWGEESQVVLIIAWATLWYSFIELFTAVLRGYNAIVTETTLVLIFRLARTALGITLIWMFRNLIVLAMAIMALSVVSSFCAAWYLFRTWIRPEFSFLWKDVRHWMGQYLPIGAGLIVTLLYWRSDVLLIRLFLSPREVGLYDAAYRLFDAVQVFPAIILAVLFPRFAAPGGFRYFWRAFGALELLAAFLMAFIFLLGGPLVRLAYGSAFTPSIKILAILFLALPAMFLNALLINYLIATRRQWAYLLAAGAALLFRIGLNLWGIPRFGLQAAAVTAVLTEGVILAACVVCWRVFLRR